MLLERGRHLFEIFLIAPATFKKQAGNLLDHAFAC